MTNFVLIVVDDMRWDLMREPSLAIVPGARFLNGHNANPVCCPSRCSTLTGNRSKTTGVYGNSLPVGGYAIFDDDDTLATRLHNNGYQTGLIGKYLNDYNPEHADIIPPGWDEWWAITADGDDYYDYQVSDNGVERGYAGDPEDYLTDVIARRAEKFICTAEEPFFAMITPVAPHIDSIPAYLHFNSLLPSEYRPVSFNVSGEKQPDWVRRKAPLDEEDIRHLDSLRMDMRTSLLAVGDLVRSVITSVTSRGVLRNTVFVFLSDNGFMWGEHKLTGKSVPYLESTRMALAIRASEFFDFNHPNKLALIQNIDIAPTFLDLAGLPFDDMDGKSLVPILRGDPGPENLFIEHHQQGQVPAWANIVTHDRTYTWYGTGEEEMYKIGVDPFQTNNIAAIGPVSGGQKAFRRLAREYMGESPPPGMEQLP